MAVRLDRPVRQRLKDLGVLGSHFLRQTNAQTDDSPDPLLAG